MSKRVLRTNLNPQEVWSKIKEVVRTNKKLSSVRDKIRWNDSQREATLSHMGVDARITVKGGVGSTIEIEVDVSFPASFFVDEDEMLSSVEKDLKKHI